MFKAIFTNSFGILFSRILGFLRDLFTASSLGANIYSDIFFIAFKLPNLFRRIFAEGAFTQVFIPAYANSKNRAVFLARIFTLFLSIIFILTLLVNILPSFATKAIAVGFDKETLILASPFVAINFWYLPLIFTVTFLSTLLQYKHHFATTAFSTALLNISLLFALYFSQDKTQIEIVYYLSYGVVIGGFLQLFVHIAALYKLGLFKLVCGGFLYIKTKSQKVVEETKKFQKQFLPAIWGNSTAQISAFLDTWLASYLASGAISYLYYSNRIFQLPLALFAIATSIALFPRIARYVKNKEQAKALLFLKKAFWLLAFLLTLSALGGFILAYEITWLLFERGAFTNTDTLHTATVLQMYMIGLLPFGLQKLFLLWIYAQERQLQAAKIATASLSSNILFSLLFIMPLGAKGLALASTISGFVGFYLTIKAFGAKKFFAILASKNALYLLAGSFLLTILLLIFKDFIGAYI